MKQKGILLVNLGTPEKAEKAAVKAFLKKFLGDRRVIKLSPILWKPILHGIILNVRPKKSAALYQQIADPIHGFPLLRYTKAQKEHLQALLPETSVAMGMSYSQPSITDSLDQLLAAGVNDLTIVPMYPQYSGTTVGAVFDEVMRYFIGKDHLVDLHFIRSYPKHPSYIQYFVDKIKAHLAQNKVDAIVFSYHGLPVNYVKAGDTYPEECKQTTQKIMEQLGDVPYFQTYQSKFGPGEWLTPATDATLKQLPKQGFKNILIVAPGFVVDCLETLEELEQENKNFFLQAGGQSFTYIPPFNDDLAFAKLVCELLE